VTKIAYNSCFGGFGLSHAATMRYAELKGLKIYPFIDVRLRDGGDRLSIDDPRRYKLAEDQEASEAFIVHYCTTPTFSNDTYWSSYDLG